MLPLRDVKGLILSQQAKCSHTTSPRMTWIRQESLLEGSAGIIMKGSRIRVIEMAKKLNYVARDAKESVREWVSRKHNG